MPRTPPRSLHFFSIFSKRISFLLPSFFLLSFHRPAERGGNGRQRAWRDGRRMEEGNARARPPHKVPPNRLSLLLEQTRRRNEPRGRRMEREGRCGGWRNEEADARSVSSFLIDSARQSYLSDLLGRSTRWFRLEGWKGMMIAKGNGAFIGQTGLFRW